MKIKLAATYIAVSALLAPYAAFAADTGTDTDRTSPKTFVKDSVITTKIKAKLVEEQPSTLAHIKVDTHGRGLVVLNGTARSQDDADKAVAIAQATEGVKSVRSHIRIKKED